MIKPDCDTCKHNLNGICVEPKSMKAMAETTTGMIRVETVEHCTTWTEGTASVIGFLTDLSTP